MADCVWLQVDGTEVKEQFFSEDTLSLVACYYGHNLSSGAIRLKQRGGDFVVVALTTPLSKLREKRTVAGDGSKEDPFIAQVQPAGPGGTPASGGGGGFAGSVVPEAHASAAMVAALQGLAATVPAAVVAGLQGLAATVPAAVVAGLQGLNDNMAAMQVKIEELGIRLSDGLQQLSGLADQVDMSSVSQETATVAASRLGVAAAARAAATAASLPPGLLRPANAADPSCAAATDVLQALGLELRTQSLETAIQVEDLGELLAALPELNESEAEFQMEQCPDELVATLPFLQHLEASDISPQAGTWLKPADAASSSQQPADTASSSQQPADTASNSQQLVDAVSRTVVMWQQIQQLAPLVPPEDRPALIQEFYHRNPERVYEVPPELQAMFA